MSRRKNYFLPETPTLAFSRVSASPGPRVERFPLNSPGSKARPLSQSCQPASGSPGSLIGGPESVNVMLDAASKWAVGADRNNVETAEYASLSSRCQEVVCRFHYVAQLQVIDRLNRIYVSPFPTRTNLNEDDDATLSCDDVNLSRRAQVVAFEDTIAAKQKIDSRDLFASFAGCQMMSFSFSEHGRGNAREGPRSRSQYPESRSQKEEQGDVCGAEIQGQ